MRSGDKHEKDFSVYVHKNYLPVLVSSVLLRSLDAGQVDVAGLLKVNQSWVLSIFEVKSSQFPSSLQWRRLRKSQDYLSKILDISTKLEVKFCQKDQP
ncbi:MAG: hypothetical protein Q7U04_17255 [Bacteriovorax sp.]|nr:hypothetical protein [Bacteriovorax sp.]